jgi:hypothetical protein
MDADESLRRFGLIPTDEQLPEIRNLLAGESEAERKGESREEDLALLCCVQLFARGLVEDVLRIWDAKSAGMDLGSAIDIQLLCGPGLEATKRFLHSQPGTAARAALQAICDCEMTGDFREFSPAHELEDYRHYFDA